MVSKPFPNLYITFSLNPLRWPFKPKAEKVWVPYAPWTESGTTYHFEWLFIYVFFSRNLPPTMH